MHWSSSSEGTEMKKKNEVIEHEQKKDQRPRGASRSRASEADGRG